VNRAQLGVAMLGGKLARALDGFLRFDGEFVPTDRHMCFLSHFLVILGEAKNLCNLLATAKYRDPSLRSG
jgi:hypothetical protein